MPEPLKYDGYLGHWIREEALKIIEERFQDISNLISRMKDECLRRMKNEFNIEEHE